MVSSRMSDDEFEAIYDSLLMQNDQYFVLRDFDSYVNIQREVGQCIRRSESMAENEFNEYCSIRLFFE